MRPLNRPMFRYGGPIKQGIKQVGLFNRDMRVLMLLPSAFN